MQQGSLFDGLSPSPGSLPAGLTYLPEFLTAVEEAQLIALVQRLPLQEARYKSYVARRRVVSYGGQFDYDANKLLPAMTLDEAFFEEIFGVSLSGNALLRFRPYPPNQPRREDVVKLQLEPRSVYAMRGVARWAWQHSVAPVERQRWSITFRTAR